MITVHHLGQSHSHVVLWLLEELGVDYEIARHERDKVTGRSPDSLRAIHPAAKAPTIVDNGVAMVESTGIILYLLDAYGAGRLRPAAGTAEAMTFYQWLTFIEGSAKGPTMQSAMPGRPDIDPATKAMIDAAAARAWGMIDAALAGQDTIVPGQFSAADIQLTFFEELVEAIGRIAPYPNMQRHLAAMRARPAYAAAEAKGGPVGLKALFASLSSRAG